MLKPVKGPAPKKVTAPKKALPPPQKKEPDEDPKLTKAKELVATFTKKLEELDEARAEFSTTYPEQAQILKQLDVKKSELSVLLEVAKAAVRESKQSVGDFQLTIPKREQGYRGDKVLKTLVDIVKESESEGHVENYEPICLLIAKLYDAGVITEIKFEQKPGQVFHARFSGDDEVKLIEEGWSEGGEELAAQCKAPKI